MGGQVGGAANQHFALGFLHVMSMTRCFNYTPWNFISNLLTLVLY